MGASTLSIAITGLNAAQAGLLTTSNNISNSNTAGYSRQAIQQTTQTPNFTGSGFIGQGTRVLTVQRQYSSFLGQQLIASQSATSQLQTYQTQLNQVDNMLGDTTVGLSPVINGFFSGLNDVAANPSSIASRQALLSSAQSLSSRFQDLSARLREIGDAANKQITTEVATINSMSREIASLNQRIIVAEAAGGQTQPANDLRDQRDQLMRDLNKHISATAMEQGDGSYSVFFGNGQPLVVGPSTFELVASPSSSDPMRTGISLTLPGGAVTPVPDDFITGGALGGLLAFRGRSLDDAQNRLGLMAMGIASAINDQHELGQDLTGVMGGIFFNVPNAVITNNANNTGSGVISVTPNDVSAMLPSDYTLLYTGVVGSEWQLTRLSDNNVRSFAAPTLPATTITPLPDGLTIDVSGTPAVGDRFKLQATYYAARDISVAITDARDIAAASPITTKTATANNGTAVVSPGEVLDPGVSIPAGGFQLRYDLATNSLVFDTASGGAYPSGPVSVSVNGVAVPGSPFTINAGAPSIPYTNGMTVEIDTDGDAANDIRFGFTGTPQQGDSFTVSQSAANTNDNRNALALAKIQTEKVLLGGTASIESAYAQMVNIIGNTAREIGVGVESQSSLLEQAEQAVQSLSGVNLDEEAANLLRYQQAYQASAKIIDISGRMFDLLASLGS